jgi:hypothetical protein
MKTRPIFGPPLARKNSSRWPSQTARDDITKGSKSATIAHPEAVFRSVAVVLAADVPQFVTAVVPAPLNTVRGPRRTHESGNRNNSAGRLAKDLHLIDSGVQAR